jgi:hypothetical protein
MLRFITIFWGIASTPKALNWLINVLILGHLKHLWQLLVLWLSILVVLLSLWMWKVRVFHGPSSTIFRKDLLKDFLQKVLFFSFIVWVVILWSDGTRLKPRNFHDFVPLLKKWWSIGCWFQTFLRIAPQSIKSCLIADLKQSLYPFLFHYNFAKALHLGLS